MEERQEVACIDQSNPKTNDHHHFTTPLHLQPRLFRNRTGKDVHELLSLLENLLDIRPSPS
jgi:hypothetical protein